jgi:hypothetical protein
MFSNEKEMKKQCKVFSVDEKMQILAQIDTRTGTRVDLAAVLGVSVLVLDTIVNKWSETENSYSHCGPLFFKEHRSLRTSSLEELEIILSHGSSKPVLPVHPLMDLI